MPEGSSQAIDISPLVRLRFAELFRSRISRSAKGHGILPLLLLVFPGHPEIDQLHIPIRMKHDVVRLHVSIDDGRILPMKIAEGIADLEHPALDILFLLRPSLLDDLVERLPFHVIHDHIDVIRGLLDINDAHDGRMLEP